MRNVLTPLAKSVFIPFGLMASASATGTAIQNKLFVSGKTALIISNEEIDDITKVVESLK